MINIWPFKKRNQHHAKGHDAFTIKSKRGSIFSIIGACFISLLTFGGAGASIAMAATEYSLGSEYSDSYNIRFELDTSMKNEDPYAVNHFTYDDSQLQQMTTNSASAYSQYLFNRGVSDFSVYPEFIPSTESSTTKAQAFINAVIPNEKGINNITGKDEYLPKENIMMDFVHSSRISVMLDLWDGKDLPAATRYVSVIPQEKLISSSNKLSIDSNNASKIDIDTSVFNDAVGKWSDLGTEWFTDTKASQMFFIQDLSGLVNRMNFILQVYHSNSTVQPQQYSDPYRYISQSEIDWAKKVFDKRIDAQDLFFLGNQSPIRSQTATYNYETLNKDWKINSNTPTYTNWAMVSRLIDQYGPDDNAPSAASVPGWMKPYILGIATASSDSTVSNSFKNYIPDKNPKNTSQNADGKWLTIPLSSKSQAQSIVNDYNDASFALPIKSYCGNSDENSADGLDGNYRVTYHSKYRSSTTVSSLKYSGGSQLEALGVIPYMHDTAINKMPPSIANNIFGSIAILGSVIALATIILLIGILVSILYRIPGIFAFGTILCSLSLTLFIMLTTGYVLSLGLLAGLFIGLIVGTMSVFAIMERIKKRYQTGIGFDNSFKVGTKKGILPSIDLHAVLLLCGVCFIYFNRLQLEIFGVSIVFVSLLSFIFNVFLWNSINWIFFSNKINMMRHNLAFSFTKTISSSAQHQARLNFDSSFHIKHDFKWFNVFGKKEILLSVLLLAIAIVGLVLFFTVGVRTSYVFYGGTRLVVPMNTDPQSLDYGNPIIVPPADWSERFFYDGFWYFFYNYTIPFDGEWAKVGVLFQSISSTAITNYVHMAINSALIASGLVCAYTLIRLNWISVIPAFIGLVSTPLLSVAILSICQVFFDINVVLSLNILYIINALFVINILSNINSTSIRSQAFNLNDLTKILNYELKNQLYYFMLNVISIIIMLLVLALFSSTTLFWFYLPIIFGLLFSIIIIFTIVPTILSFFIKIRYKYWSTNAIDNSGSQRWKSYDVIDEQLIAGINKTKRKISNEQ